MYRIITTGDHSTFSVTPIAVQSPPPYAELRHCELEETCGCGVIENAIV